MNIIKPTLLLDTSIFNRNLDAMMAKCQKSKVTLRPHCKTIQSTTLAASFRERGIDKITVSSVQMATYFADDGWDDITIAIPVNVLEIEELNALASRIKLNIVVESVEVIENLAQNIQNPIQVSIKLDIGTHRTGIAIDNFSMLQQLISQIESHRLLHFHGFIIHAGHTYGARSSHEILEIHRHNMELTHNLREQIAGSYVISIGDTPTCSVASDFGNADEIRPGNFVLYDVMQNHIGSCALSDIAVCLACPIIALHPDRNEIIVHGGGIHLSKDSIVRQGIKQYGLLAHLTDSGWSILSDDNYVSKLSQEHGTLRVTPEIMDKYKVGDVIGILPVHSCMTANLMKRYFTLDGEEISMMPVY